MTRTRLSLILAALTAVTALGGCQAVRDLQKVVSSSDKPDVRLRDVQLRGLTLTGATLDFEVDVSNPYDVDLPLLDTTYALASRGEPFLKGSADLGRTVPAGGTSTMVLPVDVTFAGLLDALSGVKPGAVVPYNAAFDVAVDAPALGRITVPVRHRGELPVPTPPSVSLDSIAWDEVGFSNVDATLKLNITNLNDFPLDLNDLGFDLALAGTRIADARIQRSTSLKSDKATSLSIPISFAPGDVGMAILSVIRGSDASYDLKGNLAASTPFGPVDLPFQQSGRTRFAR
ncbi:MAG: LEA type 2 family protein [Phycisphaerales bacterium]|nr:LEA type 2 family protein [Phycisphaerales bacterium]